MGCHLMIWPNGIPTCRETKEPCCCPVGKKEAGPHAWECEHSPDGYCHYELEVREEGGRRRLMLYSGEFVEAPPEPDWAVCNRLRLAVREGRMTNEEYQKVVAALPESISGTEEDCLFCGEPEERK